MRNPRRLWLAAVALGAVLGFSVSYAPLAGASRNASGSYSLPSGNPVVSGTAISSTWANATLADIGSELTNSLDRQGRGAMVAPLQLTSGTSSAPGLTFSSEPSSGLYRAGAGDVRMQVSSTQTQKWTATGVTFPLALTTQGGVTASASTTNSNAVTATGNGTGAGLSATGGNSNGPGAIVQGAGTGEGLRATGGASGPGAVFLGGGTGAGLQATGGASGANGGTFIGGGTNGNALSATGTGTGAGLVATGGTSSAAAGVFSSSGTAATSTVRQSSFYANNGDVTFGASNPVPASTTPVARSLTPKNLINAWAKVVSNPAAVSDGFNIASVSRDASAVTVTFASAFANTDYACSVTFHDTGAGTGVVPQVTGQTTTTVAVRFYGITGAAYLNPAAFALVFSLVCTGAQ